ncbi:MAG: 30S ribosomal protein S20 [Clostridiales bacterium]|jgi:small subunit ribosomal protein S20|nr:30S ribosomal protein S20 [Clostridiales bacterium]
MPNIKSAKKRVKISRKKTLQNTRAKSALKTYIKKAKTAVASNDENAAKLVKEASVKVDKAAAKGLIHKNTASRRKSKLAKALNAKA